MNDFTLTLGSATSDLTIENAVVIDTSTEGISTGEADLTLKNTFNLSEGSLNSSGGKFELSKDFTKNNGTLNISQTDLGLLGNIKIVSDENDLSFESLILNDYTLTLGSDTSDLTILNAVVIDTSTEGIITRDADFKLSGSFTSSNGILSSTSGIISLLAGGQISGSGVLDLTGSTWAMGGNFVKSNGTLTSSGTLTLSETKLKLESNSSLTSDESLNFVDLNLNDFVLTLGSATSDLTIENEVVIDTSTEGISTGAADLILQESMTLSKGKISSTSGIISFNKGGQISGIGDLDLTGTTWVLGSDFEKSDGNITVSNTNLSLADNNITLTSDQALSFVTLNLNYKTLTLGSETSDISVTEALTISGTTEGILSNEADLDLGGFVIIDGEGRIKSSGGKISFSNGGRLSGSAELDLTGSDWALGGDFEKRSSTGSESSGTLTLSETNLLSTAKILFFQLSPEYILHNSVPK